MNEAWSGDITSWLVGPQTRSGTSCACLATFATHQHSKLLLNIFCYNIFSGANILFKYFLAAQTNAQWKKAKQLQPV